VYVTLCVFACVRSCVRACARAHTRMDIPLECMVYDAFVSKTLWRGTRSDELVLLRSMASTDRTSIEDMHSLYPDMIGRIKAALGIFISHSCWLSYHEKSIALPLIFTLMAASSISKMVRGLTLLLLVPAATSHPEW
jgi:hypothetical protein